MDNKTPYEALLDAISAQQAISHNLAGKLTAQLEATTQARVKLNESTTKVDELLRIKKAYEDGKEDIIQNRLSGKYANPVFEEEFAGERGFEVVDVNGIKRVQIGKV